MSINKHCVGFLRSDINQQNKIDSMFIFVDNADMWITRWITFRFLWITFKMSILCKKLKQYIISKRNWLKNFIYIVNLKSNSKILISIIFKIKTYQTIYSKLYWIELEFGKTIIFTSFNRTYVLLWIGGSKNQNVCLLLVQML